MSQSYLNDNFDPNKVNKANLRKILGSNNVHFSLSASKKDLVKVFNANIESIKNSKSTNDAEKQKPVGKAKEKSPNSSVPTSSSSSLTSSSSSTTAGSRTNDSPKKRKLRNKQSKLNNLRKKQDTSFGTQDNTPAEVIVLDDEDDDNEENNIDEDSGFDEIKANQGQATKGKGKNLHITLNFPSDTSASSRKRSRANAEENEQKFKSEESTPIASTIDKSDTPSLKVQLSNKKQKKEKSPNSVTASLDSDVSKSASTNEENLSDFPSSITNSRETPSKIESKNHKLEEHKSLVIDKFEDTGSLENVSTHSITSALNRSFSIPSGKDVDEKDRVVENSDDDVLPGSNDLMHEDDDAVNEENVELFKRDIDLEKMNVSEEFKQLLQKTRDNATKEKQDLKNTPSVGQMEKEHLDALQNVETEMPKTTTTKTKSGEADQIDNEVDVFAEKKDSHAEGKPLRKAEQAFDDQQNREAGTPTVEADKQKTTLQTFEKKLQNVGNEVNSFVDVLMQEVQETVEQPVQPVKPSDNTSSANSSSAQSIVEKTISKPVKEVEQLVSKGSTAMASLANVVMEEVEKTVEQPVEQSVEQPVEQCVEQPRETHLTEATKQTTLQNTTEKPIKRAGQLISEGSKAVGSFVDVVMDEVERTVEEPVEQTPEQPIEKVSTSLKPVEENKQELSFTQDSDMEALEENAAMSSFVDVVMDEVEKAVEEPVKDEYYDKSKVSLQEQPVSQNSAESSTSFVDDALSMIETAIEQPVEDNDFETGPKPANKPVENKDSDITEGENLSFFEEVYQEVQNAIEEPVTPVLNLKKRKMSKRKSEKMDRPHKSHKSNKVSKKADSKRSSKKLKKTSGVATSTKKIRNFSIHLKLKKFIVRFAKFLYTLLLFMVFLVPVLYALWYREQQVAVGYCGHSNDAKSSKLEFKNMFGNPFAENGYLKNLGEYEFKFIDKVENWVDSTKPKCIPCPDDTAYCFPDLEIKCKADHIKKKTVKSLYGLIPAFFHDEGIYQCVKNHEKEQMVEEAVSKILKILEFKNAQKDCGLSKDDLEVGMDVEELKRIFLEARKPWFKIENFDDIWNKVLEHLKSEPEITWRQV